MASLSKNKTFILFLLNGLPSYQLPDADGEAPENILQSVCTSGFCRVLYISPRLMLLLSFSVSVIHSTRTYLYLVCCFTSTRHKMKNHFAPP
jgi:ketopantoate reductase